MVYCLQLQYTLLVGHVDGGAESTAVTYQNSCRTNLAMDPTSAVAQTGRDRHAVWTATSAPT